MTVAEELAAIGFGEVKRERICWRASRLGWSRPAVEGKRPGPEPSCSRELLRWRDLLARNPRPSPYRISRAED